MTSQTRSRTVRLIEPADLSLPIDAGDLLVQVTSPNVYTLAHIEGAVLIEPSQLCCGVPPAVGKLPSLNAIQQTLASVGYRPDRRIIAYDDEGGGWAGKLLWMLDVIGHERWAYLNGGLHAWVALGRPLSQGHYQAASGPLDFALTINPEPIAEIADVLHAIEDSCQLIWDVRSAAEYAGLRSGSARAGHIPGAVNLDWEMLKDPSRDMRLRDTLQEDLAHLGIDTARTVITHCQTHHRSGLSYLVGRLLGLNIRAYHGSWAEWGNDPDLPIE